MKKKDKNKGKGFLTIILHDLQNPSYNYNVVVVIVSDDHEILA